MRIESLNSISERLDYLIKAKKMSENAFMKTTGTNNVGKMRSGRLSITEGTISKICNSLGISYKWFKYGVGEMNDPMRLLLSEESIKKEKGIEPPIPHLITTGYVDDNSQNSTTGAIRAKEREEETLQEESSKLVQIIDAQKETIKAKDNEKHLLRKILADNGIEV